MKGIIFSIISIFTISISFGQDFAIIEDEDGYTNLRKKPDLNSEVIYKIKEYEVFFVSGYDDNNSEWVKIKVPMNKFSITEDNSCTSKATLHGYIHKSRLKYLYEFQKYKGDDLSFEYVISDFDKDKHIIQWIDGKYVGKINGRFAFGIDGDFPKNEIDDIKIKIKDNELTVHETLFEDLFECTNEFNVKKIENTYFVEQFNSDGAGGYRIVWVINNEGIKQRIIYNCY